MSRVEKLILDDSVLVSYDLKTKRIDSMANKEYRDNISVVRKIIEKNNNKFEEAQLRAAKLIIRNVNKGELYSSNEKIAEVQRLANQVKLGSTNEIVLNRILDASMDLISQEETYAHAVDIRNLKKGKTTKVYNIRFNLRYCFGLITDAFTVGKASVEKQYFELILSIIKLFMELEEMTTIDIDYLEAVIVSTLAKLGDKVEEERLISSVLKSEELKCYECKEITSNDVYKSLTILYKIKVIENVDGFVYLIEDILI